MSRSGYRVGVDVGGTFTDFALVSGEAADPVVHHKVPSTPAEPAEAIARGLSELLAGAGLEPDQLSYLGHGTTVATNQLIERKGAPTGLLTTMGFRDVLEIARQTRPHLYDYSIQRAPALVPRRWRLEVGERIDASGRVLRALDEEAVIAAARHLAGEGVSAVAICFLHSYRNPAHEERARTLMASVMPSSVRISTSSEVLPEFREFERFSTTCANAFLAPRMADYLARFLSRLEAMGVRTQPFTFHSNGGLMSPETVRRFPVRTCLSGPAAGVVGAAAIARSAGFPDVVTFDVGGTSTDVSLIADAQPGFSQERSVAGYVVKSPTIDVHVIGAGGGSIAWVDEGGALKVGPRSAGASPGPAAYGHGGEDATLTDAQVVLQRLNPRALLGGALTLDGDAAQRVIGRLAGRLGRDPVEAADGIVQVAVASIARAIRAVSTERGFELSRFALMAYGGAGPALAGDVAREVRCGRVIVPLAPGAMCARGILVSDISTDYVRTSACTADESGWATCRDMLAELGEEANAWLESESVRPEDRETRASVDARYLGQGFEVSVPVTGAETLEQVCERFHASHERQYGYALEQRRIELVNCRMQAIGKTGRELPAAVFGSDGAVSPSGERDVYVGAGWQRAPVYQRAELGAGAVIVGPAVIEELSSTTLLSPPDRARVDRWGNLVIEVGAAPAGGAHAPGSGGREDGAHE